jgi:hypothetical protein
MTNTFLSRQFVSLDTLIVLVVLVPHIVGKDAFLEVVMLLAYLLTSIFFPLPQATKPGNLKSRIGFVLRLTWLWVLVTTVVILPTVINVVERRNTPVGEGGFSPANITLSDSALQTELALAYLDTGLNPYVESYSETPLRFYQWLDVGDPNWQDPAYHYFVYFPGILYISYPVYKLAQSLNLFYDQRLVYVAIYICFVLLLPALVQKPDYKLGLTASVALNPLLTSPIILGMNDIASLLGIILAILFLQRKRFLWAAFLIGVACAIKQYAWFMTPFFLFYIWQQSDSDQKIRQFIKAVGLISVVVFLTALPFIVWDFHAFYTDTFAFPAGRAELLYPVRGFTIGRLLMGAGIIPTYVSPFPFQWLQLLIGIPALGGLLWYQSGKELGVVLFSAAVFIFVFGFLSRFFHHNYVGIVSVLATMGIMLDFHSYARETEENNLWQP